MKIFPRLSDWLNDEGLSFSFMIDKDLSLIKTIGRDINTIFLKVVCSKKKLNQNDWNYKQIGEIKNTSPG